MSSRINRWLIAAGEWVVLLPLWRKLIRRPGRRVAAVMATGLVWLLIAVAVAGLGDDDDANDSASQAAAKESATPTRTARPTRTRIASPSQDAVGTATPEPATTPASTPAASAVPAPDGTTPVGAAPPAPAAPLIIVSSSLYTDSDSTLHVAGEVRNTTTDYIDYVEITGTFFDASGQVVASEYTFTHVDLVAPGASAGFDLGLANGAGLGVSRYELAVQGEVSADRPAAGLVIQGESANVDGGGDYHVVGTVVNQSAAVAEFVKVIGTFYGADGTVVRSDLAYTELEVVPPGGSDTFDLNLPDGGSAGIARYSLVVEGFPV
jgi:hypothetical protein